jgi:DNA-binding response OmpR family regulator
MQTRRFILVIEDEVSVRRNVGRFLSLEGYEVQEAANGEEGIAAAMRRAPDLVICDLMMPGKVDGFGVLAHLRAEPRTAGTPFIFLTANTEPRNSQTGMLLGASDYLAKPLDLDVLGKKIAERLGSAGS